MPTHLANSAKLKAEVASSKNDLKVKELILQTLPGVINEAAGSCEEVKKVYTEASDSDVFLQNLEALRAEVAAVWD